MAISKIIRSSNCQIIRPALHCRHLFQILFLAPVKLSHHSVWWATIILTNTGGGCLPVAAAVEVKTFKMFAVNFARQTRNCKIIVAEGGGVEAEEGGGVVCLLLVPRKTLASCINTCMQCKSTLFGPDVH